MRSSRLRTAVRRRCSQRLTPQHRLLCSLPTRASPSSSTTKYNGIHAVPFSLTKKEAISAFREQQGSVRLGADTSNVKLRAKAILLPFLCYDVSVTTTAAGRCGWNNLETYTDDKGNRCHVL